MKQDQLVKAVMRGDRLLVGEYRSTKIEHIQYRDKVSGKTATFTACRHTVEFGPDSVQVNERVPDSFDEAKFQPPAKKGAAVVLHMDSFVNERGSMKASGRIEILES